MAREIAQRANATIEHAEVSSSILYITRSPKHCQGVTLSNDPGVAPENIWVWPSNGKNHFISSCLLQYTKMGTYPIPFLNKTPSLYK